MRLQRMLDNGKWVDDDRTEHFIALAQAINPDAIALLESGNEIKWSKDFWFAKIRQARPAQQRLVIETPTTLCSCGHTVNSNLVMNASRGTSCPDCYDNGSN